MVINKRGGVEFARFNYIVSILLAFVFFFFQTLQAQETSASSRDSSYVLLKTDWLLGQEYRYHITQSRELRAFNPVDSTEVNKFDKREKWVKLKVIEAADEETILLALSIDSLFRDTPPEAFFNPGMLPFFPERLEFIIELNGKGRPAFLLNEVEIMAKIDSYISLFGEFDQLSDEEIDALKSSAKSYLIDQEKLWDYVSTDFFFLFDFYGYALHHGESLERQSELDLAFITKSKETQVLEALFLEDAQDSNQYSVVLERNVDRDENKIEGDSILIASDDASIQKEPSLRYEEIQSLLLDEKMKPNLASKRIDAWWKTDERALIYQEILEIERINK